MSVSVPSSYVPNNIPNRNSIALVNLLLRNTPTRLTVIQVGEVEPDPELYVVTSVEWRDMSRPLLPQLPKILAILETMRGTKGVPSRVYLDSDEGLQLYIPTGTFASQVPSVPKHAVKFLKGIVEATCDFVFRTSTEVEETFWKIAMKRGFSQEIVERMAQQAKGYESTANINRFHDLLQRYFSIRFRIHTAESILHVES
jgi:hypothetical protein